MDKHKEIIYAIHNVKALLWISYKIYIIIRSLFLLINCIFWMSTDLSLIESL